MLLNYHIGRIVLGSLCVGDLVRLGLSGVRVCFSLQHDTTPTQLHRYSNTHRTKNNKTNLVIQQHSRKFLMMDVLISETRWAHKKWNKIASDIKLVFYSSAITMMHVPINIRHIYMRYFIAANFWSKILPLIHVIFPWKTVTTFYRIVRCESFWCHCI